MRLVTITLGFRKWETTSIADAICFVHSFGGDSGFRMITTPYDGKEVPNIISVI